MFRQLLFLTGGGDSHAIVHRLSKLSENSTFTELYISGIHIDEIIEDAVVKVLQFKRNWVGIHIAHCTGRLNELIESVMLHDRVKKVSLLSDADHLNAPFYTAIGLGLKTNKSITSLMIRLNLSCELANALCDGLSHSSTLEYLSVLITGSQIGAIELLATGLQRNNSLKQLKFNRSGLVHVNIDDRHIIELTKALKYHPSLKSLSIQGSSCREAGIAAIASHIESNNCKLAKLDLSNHHFGVGKLFGCRSLASALATNKHLKSLSLSGHQLSEQEVGNLAMGLSQGSDALEELIFSNCGITDKSACIIAGLFPKMQLLKYLWLNDNPFGCVGAKEICEALRMNFELEELSIPRGLGKEMHSLQRTIEFYLVLNEGGRRLLSDDNVPISLWPVVLARAENTRWEYFSSASAQADVIYYLLKGPATFER
jgi:hypothetical protein